MQESFFGTKCYKPSKQIWDVTQINKPAFHLFSLRTCVVFFEVSDSNAVLVGSPFPSGNKVGKAIDA